MESEEDWAASALCNRCLLEHFSWPEVPRLDAPLAFGFRPIRFFRFPIHHLSSRLEKTGLALLATCFSTSQPAFGFLFGCQVADLDFAFRRGFLLRLWCLIHMMNLDDLFMCGRRRRWRRWPLIDQDRKHATFGILFWFEISNSSSVLAFRFFHRCFFEFLVRVSTVADGLSLLVKIQPEIRRQITGERETFSAECFRGDDRYYPCLSV